MHAMRIAIIGAATAIAAACSPATQTAPATQAEVGGVETPLPAAEAKPELALDRDEFAVMIADAGPAYIAGQPTEAALEALATDGVTTVINLRTHAEMSDPERVAFDEAEKVNALGMEYVQIEQGPEGTLTPVALDAFAAAMAQAEGKVLVHCASGVRASQMWAAYLVREKGLTMEAAVAEAETMNLRSEAPVRSLLALED